MGYESWSLKPNNWLNILTGSSSFNRGSALFALLLILQGLVHNLDHRDTEGLRRTMGNCHDSVSVKINIYSVDIQRKKKKEGISPKFVSLLSTYSCFATASFRSLRRQKSQMSASQQSASQMCPENQAYHEHISSTKDEGDGLRLDVSRQPENRLYI